MTPPMSADVAAICALADRVEAMKASDNAVDVLCEIALFRPSTTWASIRANAAGSKVIYTDQNGRDATFRSDDWTHEVLGGPRVRSQTGAALRARAAALQQNDEG